MDTGERLRRVCEIPANESSLADFVWAKCSDTAPGTSALVFGTVDGVISQGDEILHGNVHRTKLELLGAAAFGAALASAPKCVVLPAAFIGGAGTISFLHDVQHSVNRVLPVVFDADAKPKLARKVVASEFGPLTKEATLLAASGIIGACCGSGFSRTSLYREWWQLRRTRMAFRVGPDNHLADFRSYKLPHVDLRYFAPTPGARSRLQLLGPGKIQRTVFGGSNELNFSPYAQLTDDDAKHSLIKRFKLNADLKALSDDYLRIPLLPREYSNVACGFRSKMAAESKMYKHARDSIVQIQGSGRGDQSWSGSGFFVSPDGKIATALHVVADADRIQVRSSSGTKYDAALIAHDFDADLAVLKVQGTKALFKPLPLAKNSDQIKSDVYLFGHPAGSETMFMSPALFHRRGFERAYLSPPGSNQILYRGRVFETRAYFVHDRTGNSGGPVLNSDGKVIALHTDADLHSRNTYDEVRVGVGAASSELDKLLRTVRHDPIPAHQVWKPHLLFSPVATSDQQKPRWWSFLLP